jgi:hypothetical protein
MVHFPALSSTTYVFSRRYLGINQGGFPHSEISGSTPVCGSPKLIAAYHVLHRLLAPRHPPYALSSLTSKPSRLMPSERRGRANPDALHLVQQTQSTLRCVWSEKTTVCRIFSCQRTAAPVFRAATTKIAWQGRAVRLRRLASLPSEAHGHSASRERRLVENTGLEPVTSWLQTRRSPS